jgi:asparagine synthase (glutamine-hydrolysing)
MCGITGYISKQSSTKVFVLNNMLQKIQHRGPDSFGVWKDSLFKIGLGHARLSILDLSDAGHQPMTSNCDRLVLVFNGEIYNYLDLRLELQSSKSFD